MSTWPVRLLIGCLAILLPAGAWAASAIDPGAPTTVVAGGPARATGLGANIFLDDQGAPPPAVNVTPPSIRPTTPAPATSTSGPSTTTKPPATTPPSTSPNTAPTTTLATLLPGVPLPVLPPILDLQQRVNSWSSANGQTTARMRMEPAAPVPGQPVRFFVEIVAPEPCCVMPLSYGDGLAAPSPGGGCDSPKTRTATLTHTFAAPGDYELRLVALTFPCNGEVVDGQEVVPPTISGTVITACIGVGRLLGHATCVPYNHFGPGTVYSSA